MPFVVSPHLATWADPVPFADLRTGGLAPAELVQTKSKAGMQRGLRKCCLKMKAEMMHMRREFESMPWLRRAAVLPQPAAEALDHWQYRAQPAARESYKNHTSLVLMYRYMYKKAICIFDWVPILSNSELCWQCKQKWWFRKFRRIPSVGHFQELLWLLPAAKRMGQI